MWVFLATEVLFFGGIFITYTIYRGWYPEAFAAGSRPPIVHPSTRFPSTKRPKSLGMWTFIAARFLVSGAILLTHTSYRRSHPEAFAARTRQLDTAPGTIKTENDAELPAAGG